MRLAAQWCPMKARNLLDGAASAYQPKALKAIGQAFDEAWLTIAGNFSSEATEAARIRLANAILSVAQGDSLDVAALKRGGLEAMALSYHADHSDLQRDPALAVQPKS